MSILLNNDIRHIFSFANCIGQKIDVSGTRESCQLHGVRRGFSPGTQVLSTRKSGNQRNFILPIMIVVVN